jgi:hypothetical protein
MNRFYPVAVVLVLGLILAGIAIDAASVLFFIDVPSLAVVLVPVLAMSFASFTPREIGGSFRAAFVRSHADAALLRTAAAFFRALERYIILSGFLGVLIGLVSMLVVMGSGKGVPDNKVTVGFSLLLLSVFYALVFLLLIAVPFRSAADRKLAEETGKRSG